MEGCSRKHGERESVHITARCSIHRQSHNNSFHAETGEARGATADEAESLAAHSSKRHLKYEVRCESTALPRNLVSQGEDVQASSPALEAGHLGGSNPSALTSRLARRAFGQSAELAYEAVSPQSQLRPWRASGCSADCSVRLSVGRQALDLEGGVRLSYGIRSCGVAQR